MTVDISSLKKVKNSVIGNPIAKLELSQDVNFIKFLINCLEDRNIDVCIEAANILSSLSYASPSSFITLLRLNAPRAFLFSINNFTPTTPPSLRTAFTRALRSITISIADIVGPSLWGLNPEHSIPIREEAKEALEYVLQLDSLDVWLPLLEEGGTAVPMMLASVLRSAEYRRVVAEWVPLEMRQKEVKTRRGWEKMGVGGPFGRQGGWVARGLVGLLNGRDAKVQEAALSALASLAKENPVVASALCKSPNDKDPSPLSSIITLTRSRHIDVQLAACLCATHITRARHPPPPPDDGTIRIILSTLIRFISPQSTDTAPNKIKATFILYFLTSDDSKLSELAHSRGCVMFLGRMLKELVIVPPTSVSSVGGRKEARDQDGEQENGATEDEEPESTAQLREAVLTALGSLSLFSETVRRIVTDELGLLPCLLVILNRGRRPPSPFSSPSPSVTPPSSSSIAPTSITSYTKPKHVGTRYAACHLIRALSRSVSVLRTSIVDSGLGMAIFRVFMDGWYVDGEGNFIDGKEKRDEDGKGKEEGEDRRVVGAALAAVCNVVNEFSVLKAVYLEQGILKRLVSVIMNSGDLSLKINVLWAIKNLIWKTETETKRNVMREVGWGYLIGLLTDPDESVQEQAFAILRNLTESEEGIEMVFTEVGPKVLDVIAATLGGSACACDDVVLQAANTLGNLSNTSSEASQSLILTHPHLLTSLRTSLAESRADIKKPLVSAVWELVKPDPRGRRGVFVDAGIVGTLRRLCEWTGVVGLGGGVGTSPSSPTSLGGGGAGRRGSNASSPTTSIAIPGGGAGGGGGGVYGSWGGGAGGATYFGLPVYYHSPHHAGAGGHHGHTGGGQLGFGGGLDGDKDVVERARVALDWLEHGNVYVGT